MSRSLPSTILLALSALTGLASGGPLRAQEVGTPAGDAPPQSAVPFVRDSAALVFGGDTVGFVYGETGSFVRAAPPDTSAAAPSTAAGTDPIPALAGNLRATLLGLLWTVLATLGLWGLLRGMGVWYPRLYRRIRDIQEDKLPSLRYQELVILSGERIENAILVGARMSRLVVTGFVLFLYFPLVFSFFPPTRVLAQRIYAMAWEPLRLALLAVAAYLPNLFYIAVIVVLAHYGLRLVRMVFMAVDHGTIRLPGFYPDWALPTYSLVRVLGVAFALILIWPYLPNSDSLAFKGVAGFLGLLVTFGSAGAVSNVVGGVVMIYMRPFQIGDRVKIADTVGDVVERGMLVTRLRTPKNVEVTIPNSMVLGNYIVNFSSAARERGIILHTTATIGYDVPWRSVHEALKEAARRTEGILADPEPFVLQTALGDYAVSYELNAHTDQADRMAGLYSGLHQNIQDTMAEAGIEILSPVYHALRDGHASTLPAPHAPPASATPAFRVRDLGTG